MKWFTFSLRTKLIIYFVLVIVIPIIFYIVFFNVLSLYINNNNVIVEVDTILERFEERISANIGEVDNYSNFKSSIDDLLITYGGSLQIINPENDQIIFNSEKREQETFNYNNLNINSITNTDYFTYLNEIETPEGEYVYSLVLNVNMMFQGVQGRIIKYIVVGIIISIILLIFLVYYFSRVISRQILIPLEELNEATKNIAEGNLDYEIDYCGDNELGSFCEAFETMRLKLKKSLEKQAIYENNRKELIASISHDLKTPITSIQGYVEGLIDGVYKDEKTYNKYLTIIKDKSIRLNHLIDDLFYFSKLELDKLEVNKKEYNSKEIFEEILTSYKLEFEQIRQKLIIEKPIPDLKINIDKHRIDQVFDNIIKNAREFMDEDGTVKVSFDVEDNYLVVNIADNGVGIKEEVQKNIFEKFYRGEKSRNRQFGGTGLGLAICKEIIEAHNGEIGVYSKTNEGSTFYFKLPIVD
ncbi:MAG: HAMP domain-containing sensor histidine kinase [Bacillota bacterium]